MGVLPYVGAVAILYGTAWTIDRYWRAWGFMGWMDDPK